MIEEAEPMQVSCPGCKRSYNIDESALPEAGKKMRCPKCTTVFTVTKKGTGTFPAPTAAPKAAPPLAPKKPDSPKIPTSSKPRADEGMEFNLPERPGEDDFSDVRIPSLVPRAVSEPARPKRALTGEFDLDAGLKASLSPLPNSSPPDADGFDFSGFEDPILSSAPPKRPSLEEGRRDTIDLPSMPPNMPSVELDHSDEIHEHSSPSLPAALGLPETSDEIKMPRISFHETPALTTLAPEEPDDDFGAIDFGPTVEKSGEVMLDDDAEFDFRGSEPDEAVPFPDDQALDRHSFGEIELADDEVPAAPKTPPSPPPKRAPAPPTQKAPPPTVKVQIPTPFQMGEANVSSLPPLGAALESDEAPFAGMPSPADLLKLADEPPPHPRTTADLTRPSGALELPENPVGSAASDYGEVDLPASETSGVLDLDAEEFDAFPVRRTSTTATLDNLDLAADPLDLRQDAEAPTEAAAATREKELDESQKRGPFEGRRRFERQSRRTKLLLLGLLTTLVLVGAGLSFTSLGPFGANILFRMLPKPVNSQAVGGAISSADKKIARDTQAAYKDAIREIEEIHREYPGSEDLQFYLVYLYYMAELRFGEDKALDAKATEVLGVAGFAESKSPNAPAAQAAQYLRFSRPVPGDAEFIGALSQTANGLVLLTESALRRSDPAKALSTVKMLETKEASPRSAYLAGRVLLAQGDRAHIAEAASRLLKLNETAKDHVEAGLLAAEAMLSQKEFDPHAVRKVIEEAGAALKNQQDAPAPLRAELHGLKARLFVFERNYLEAEKEVALAEQLNSENLSMLLAKGRIALTRRDYSTAAGAFAKAIGNAPKNIDAALGKIETDIRGGELAESKKALEALLPAHPDVALAHYLMGEIQIALKENAPGEAELKKAVELDKMLLEAYVRLSTFYLAEGRNEEAMQILDKASATVPGSPLIKKTLAAGHAARGDWSSAIVELDNALKIDPDDVEAHFQMAVMYRKMDSLDDAKRALDEVEKRNPSYPGLALEQGLLMERRGDTASALSAYKKALSLAPSDVSLMLRVGVASFLAGDPESAETELKAVLEKEPASPEANFYYGETLRTTNRNAESLEFLLKATELAPDNALYHLRYGTALEVARDAERAMEQLQTAIRLEPKTAEAYIVIGKIKLHRGAVRDAVQSLEKGLTMNPALNEGYLAAAEAYEQLSDMSDARKYYRKAAEVLPNNPEVHYRLGLAELQTNGKSASFDAFTKATSLAAAADPKPDWYYEALYRRGVAERAKGMRAQAVATFKQYLEDAPDNAIDRSEVAANLDEMGM